MKRYYLRERLLLLLNGKKTTAVGIPGEGKYPPERWQGDLLEIPFHDFLQKAKVRLFDTPIWLNSSRFNNSVKMIIFFAAEAFHLVSRRPVAFALGTVANKQGRVAGVNIAGGQAVFPGVVGTSMVKVFDWEVARKDRASSGRFHILPRAPPP